MKKISTKTVAKNVSIVLIVQVVYTIISFVIGFIVPKFISESTYSQWQVYMLYVNYSALFHFGVYDGFIIRYSQYDYEELDKELVRSQFYFINLILDIIGGVLLIVIGIVSQQNFVVILLIVLGIILKNVFRYSSYTFQTTNAISDYSISLLIERVGFVLIVILLLILRIDNFIYFCVADCVGNVVATIYGLIKRPNLFFGHLSNFKKMLREYWKNLSVGIFVTIATFSFSFLITGAKMIVQWFYDELIFGQVSFSVSIMNTFLAFISSASIVLLPSLKRMDADKLPLVYKNMRSILSVVLFVGIAFYFPAAWILGKWLPNYSTGIIYAGIILPSVIFSAKVNLLTNNYLKHYFKEKVLLVINISTMVAGFGLFYLSACVLNNIYLILYFMNILCMLNSIIAEIVVSKLIGQKLYFNFIEEIVLGVAFVVVLQLFSLWIAFAIYSCLLIIYLIIHRKTLIEMFANLKKRFSKKEQKNK